MRSVATAPNQRRIAQHCIGGVGHAGKEVVVQLDEHAIEARVAVAYMVRISIPWKCAGCRKIIISSRRAVARQHRGLRDDRSG